jgi:hypothetical protein
VIFVVCVGALLWAAFAAARHIRRHEIKAAVAGDTLKNLNSPDAVIEDHEMLVSLKDNQGD